MGKTPYEAWHGQPPAGHLRVIGCDAYAHVPMDERRKLDSKAKKCVHLGYGDTTKGYRLYDPEKDRYTAEMYCSMKLRKQDQA